jgi:hypothetical protein
MNNNNLYHQRNKALQRVNEKYPEVFEGKPELQAANSTFAGNNERITELNSVLARPRPLVFGPKKDLSQKLAVSLSRKAGIGILIATRQNDVPKLNMYKGYKRAASHNNVWNLYQTSLQVATELAKEGEQAADAGLPAEELAAFQSQVEEFGLIIESTDNEVKERKAARQERDTLMAANIGILRYQLEPFANLVQDLYPAFFRDFKIARRSPLPRKATAKEVEILTDLSGTVTNSSAGEPIAGATVMITELNLVTTTDEDGYYLYDEVPVGSFTVSCHTTGYKLPANVPVTVTGTEPLQLDFQLEPEVGEQAA